MRVVARILLLDDESDSRQEVADFLRGYAHEVVEVGSIRQFHQYFESQKFDIALLDRMLPDGDGLDLCAELRSAGYRCGLIMFTARDASRDRITGYQMGADHYVTKPVRLEELAALIETLAWRVEPPRTWTLSVSKWSITSPAGHVISLTAQEMSFISVLARSAGKVLTRRQIVDGLGKDMSSYDPRNLDALVLRLRRKVSEVTSEPMPIKTVHGTGYSVTQAMTFEQASEMV